MVEIEFDVEKFREAIRSLYFLRTRGEAADVEDILIAQVEAIVERALNANEAVRGLVGGRGMTRLVKLLSGEERPVPEWILNAAADRIEVLEAKVTELSPLPEAQEEATG